MSRNDDALILVREFKIQVGDIDTMVSISYITTDPYAVVLTIPDARGSIMWTFSRDLLKGGGEGDVKVTHGLTLTKIELSNTKQTATLTFNKYEVDTFLRMVYAMVKDGDESRQIDWDKELSRLTD